MANYTYYTSTKFADSHVMTNGQGNYLCSGSNTGTNKKKISSLNSSNGHSIGSNSSNGKSKNKKPGKKLVKHKQKCRGRPKKKI